MTLFQKSIHKDLLRNFGGATVVLFTIVMTIMLIRILSKASKGQVDPSEVILLIGLNGIGNAAPILTLSLFVSIVYTFSRMFLESEMVIWFSSGVSLSQFLKPLLRFAWPVLLIIALLALFAWPWSNVQTQYKFLALNQGHQTVIDHQTGQVRMTEFSEFKYWLDPSVRQILPGMQSQMLDTAQLLKSKERNNQGELFWRIGLFLAAINLAMLAIPLASVNPRIGRSYSLGIALLCFVGYYNMLTIGKRLIADGSASFSGMMLIVHGTATLIVMAWYLHTEFNLHWRRLIPSK